MAFLAFGLLACTTDVDDPTNFTAGNSQGNSSSSSSGDGPATDGNTSGVGTGSATGMTGADGTTTDPTPETTTGANGNCGNGVIDAGEQCDGGDLQGFDCNSLGLNGGTLACDAVMCTFDTSMCGTDSGTT